MQNIGNAFAAKAQSGPSNNKKDDDDDLFGEMISQKLEKFSVPKKVYLKQQIQSWIYDSQMETSEPTNNLMPQSPEIIEKIQNFNYYTNLLNG